MDRVKDFIAILQIKGKWFIAILQTKAWEGKALPQISEPVRGGAAKHLRPAVF